MQPLPKIWWKKFYKNNLNEIILHNIIVISLYCNLCSIIRKALAWILVFPYAFQLKGSWFLSWNQDNIDLNRSRWLIHRFHFTILLPYRYDSTFQNSTEKVSSQILARNLILSVKNCVVASFTSGLLLWWA